MRILKLLFLVIGVVLFTSSKMPKELWDWKKVAINGIIQKDELNITINIPPKYLRKKTVLNMDIKIKVDTVITDSVKIFVVGEKVEIDRNNMFSINSRLGGKIELNRKLKIKNDTIEKLLIVDCKGYNYQNPKIFRFFPPKSTIIKHREEQRNTN